MALLYEVTVKIFGLRKTSYITDLEEKVETSKDFDTVISGKISCEDFSKLVKSKLEDVFRL